ncbi:RES family NAD+ phosphorylase [Subtercola sp. RTI3]|uniref:RES family NAD+ phosphorylase n=1 Tax=Subtercola sp. RTI3 TaxID=3048639 RepID=UPI002B235272|nr:RES family NAD+ phosphorylase [Subtercola sp. RTI3]MEA9986075.1 RES family NAD+ phosphorylase [Subtercola sp. RTI3]
MLWLPLALSSMPAELALVAAPSVLWRVERAEPPLRFSQLNLVDAANDRAGNRFDVPGAGVLYGATEPSGGFAETLAGYRPRASMLRAFSEVEAVPGRELPGDVSVAWLRSRRLRSFTTVSALPFVDVESPATHTHLTAAAADVLVQQGIENLDVAHIRGPSRRLTRAIASWVYSRTDTHGDPLYAGIRYMSRLGAFECWAVFDGTTVELLSSSTIAPADEPLTATLKQFGMTIRPAPERSSALSAPEPEARAPASF